MAHNAENSHHGPCLRVMTMQYYGSVDEWIKLEKAHRPIFSIRSSNFRLRRASGNGNTQCDPHFRHTEKVLILVTVFEEEALRTHIIIIVTTSVMKSRQGGCGLGSSPILTTFQLSLNLDQSATPAGVTFFCRLKASGFEPGQVTF